MSYQVLARKYRPQTFETMTGQEHVLRALINALDKQRLHHAYLFTGTRGVGKTSIARILAKCLNCEVGISSKPCGKCDSCQEIDNGNFVDLIEVDAASRTKVEDTRELLDNVQYMPTRGRFKIYLIDEVHMLSGHSFNALLKTLEEPPPHVKFLLATTTPQKLPVTVLSRCLQFHLKNLPPELIAKYLQYVLKAEKVSSENEALQQIARAADGSMRDALSLLDQAISFGQGQVNTTDISAMLGTIEQHHVENLLRALAAQDGKQLLDICAQLAEHAADFSNVLEELISFLHQIAITQAIPEIGVQQDGKTTTATELGKLISKEDIQLYYQIALIGRRDLPLAADPKSGLEMILLRMLAFQPKTAKTTTPNKKPQTPSSRGLTTGSRNNKQSQTTTTPRHHDTTTLKTTTPNKKPQTPSSRGLTTGSRNNKQSQTTTTPQHHDTTTLKTTTPNNHDTITINHWPDFLTQLKTTGITRSLAANCSLASSNNNGIELILNENYAALLNKNSHERLNEVINQHFSKSIKLIIKLGQTTTETPAEITKRQTDKQQQDAIKTIEEDPNVQSLVEKLGVIIDPSLIKSE
jgi:DNA polymerase III subunit gamma/tau